MHHCSLLRLRQSWGVCTLAAGRQDRWEERVSLEEHQQKDQWWWEQYHARVKKIWSTFTHPIDKVGKKHLPGPNPTCLCFPLAIVQLCTNPLEVTRTGQGWWHVYKKTCISGSISPSHIIYIGKHNKAWPTASLRRWCKMSRGQSETLRKTMQNMWLSWWSIWKTSIFSLSQQIYIFLVIE